MTTLNFTLDKTFEGLRTLTRFAGVPKPAFHLVERALNRLRDEAADWTLAELQGLPNTFGDDRDGNIRVSWDADQAGTTFGDGCYQNGIPAAAAVYLSDRIDAAFAMLAAYRVD